MSQALQLSGGLKELVKSPGIAQRMREVLGQRAPQFVSSLISIGEGMKKVEPKSIVAAAMTAAALDLPIDKNLGFAWIVPYKGLAQFQMGYKGYIQLALRTGQYRKMNATAVNFDAWGGFDEVGDPVIKWDLLDYDQPAVAYAVAWQMVSGFTKVFAWKKERVIAHAKRYSQAYIQERNTPWKTHFDEMALKTVIKMALSHWGIMSIEMRQAVTVDQGVQKDIDGVVAYPDTLQLSPGKQDDEGEGTDLGPVKTLVQDAEVQPRASQPTMPEQGAQISRPAPTPEPPLSPQAALRAVIVAESHSFDNYRRVGIASGWFPEMDPTSWEDFNQIPAELAETHLAARKTILRKLKEGAK